MSAPARRALVDHDDPALPVVAQCRLLKIARSTLYYRPAAVDPDDLALMRRMDELYLASPFYGSRRMVAVLRREGVVVNRKRVRRLMRLMGLEAIYQKPNTSQGHPDHKVYPYLLRGLIIDRPNQVWCADITYIPMAEGLSTWWRSWIGSAGGFCRGGCRSRWRRSSASRRFRKRWPNMAGPKIFNTDQGVQFTSAGFRG